MRGVEGLLGRSPSHNQSQPPHDRNPDAPRTDKAAARLKQSTSPAPRAPNLATRNDKAAARHKQSTPLAPRAPNFYPPLQLSKRQEVDLAVRGVEGLLGRSPSHN